jgi:hypothetical protein
LAFFLVISGSASPGRHQNFQAGQALGARAICASTANPETDTSKKGGFASMYFAGGCFSKN